MENSDRPPRNERAGDRSEVAAEGRTEPGTDGRDGRESRNERRPRRDNPDRHSATPVNGDAVSPVNGVAMAGDRAQDARAENAHGMAANSDQPSAHNDGTEGREKRSRDRYGRERGPRGERSARDGGEERQDRPLREQQQPLEGFATEPAPVEVGAVSPATALIPVVTAPPPPAGAAPMPAGLPKVQPFVLPMDELAQVAESSGLRWINSDAEKISAVQVAIAAQPPAIHVPRARQVLPVVDEGPLMLVETKRDLRNMTLPFEQTAN